MILLYYNLNLRPLGYLIKSTLLPLSFHQMVVLESRNFTTLYTSSLKIVILYFETVEKAHELA